MKTDAERVREILSFIGGTAERFAKLDERGYRGLTELRFRTGWPPELFYGTKCAFLSGGELSAKPENAPPILKRELFDIYKALCGYSIHSHQEELRRGFVTIRGGHRAGICGTAVYQGGEVDTVRDVSSVNIRVAREVFGAADKITAAMGAGACGVLIVGPPCSGKTTVLRDLARQFSYGKQGRPIKISVIDERGELAAVWQGEPQNDLGPCCDILDGWDKTRGIEAAVRALSPELIVCDEIGSDSDAGAILRAANCGVAFAASVHASGAEELNKRQGIRSLLEAGIFKKTAFLKSAGGEVVIMDAGDVIADV